MAESNTGNSFNNRPKKTGLSNSDKRNKPISSTQRSYGSPWRAQRRTYHARDNERQEILNIVLAKEDPFDFKSNPVHSSKLFSSDVQPVRRKSSTKGKPGHKRKHSADITTTIHKRDVKDYDDIKKKVKKKKSGTLIQFTRELQKKK
eukprot:TRINITY_DN7663_c0_g2_i1.p1 TRINITY_DN7663_c0_g2~~TRINITY_DN7663_c0_g2_i1.p1  ORF type:complete len:147 (-),score=27.37 TRINITY_DN7663_c0_g2_i1:455-895(-)